MDFSKISKTAMVLAAGLGTRLRPLTDTLPKPLIPLNQNTDAPITLLDYHLHALKKSGFERVIVNTHYLAAQIQSHLEKYAPLPYTISYEETLLDTGGGLANVCDHFDRPFLVVNSDAFTAGDIKRSISTLVDYFNPAIMDDLLLYALRSCTQGFSENLDFFMKNNITIPCQKTPSERIEYLGLQIIKPELFKGKSGSFSVFDIWHSLINENRLHGFIDEENDNIWFDTGHIAGLSLAREAFNHPLPLKKCSRE